MLVGMDPAIIGKKKKRKLKLKKKEKENIGSILFNYRGEIPHPIRGKDINARTRPEWNTRVHKRRQRQASGLINHSLDP